MLINQLLELGFHKNEVIVYLALIELGKAKAGELIIATKLHRNLVYTSLAALQKKQLIAKTTRRGIAIYEADGVESLVSLAERKKTIAQDVVKELKKKQSAIPRDIKVFEGVSGVTEARERSLLLPADETVYVLGGSQGASTPEFENFWQRYHRKRIRRGINFKILFDQTVPSDYLNRRNALEKTEAKYLPFDVELPARFEMFGDTFSVGVHGDEPIVFSMRSKDAVESMKKYFNYLWNQEVVVGTGIEALERVFHSMLNELESGEEYYVLGASTSIYTDEKDNYKTKNVFDEIHRARIRKGVIVKMLAYREYMQSGIRRFIECGDPERKISFIKPFISRPGIPMQINLYKNKTIIIFYSENPTVLTFSRPEMYLGFKAYFDSLWN